MTEIVVALGSNFQAEKYLVKAVHKLTARFGLLNISRVYKSCALCENTHIAGKSENTGNIENINESIEGDYLNMAVSFNTQHAPSELIACLKNIEYELDRREDSKRRKEISIDLDLLLYGDDVVVINERSYPSKDSLKHSFVLAPLVDVAGEKRDCYTKSSYSELWQALDKDRLPVKIIALDF